MGNSRSKGRGRFGFLFWTAFILFVAVIYLANREDISAVLESTQFVEVVSTKIKGEDPRVVVERRQEPVPEPEGGGGDGSMEGESAADSEGDPPSVTTVPAEDAPPVESPAEDPVQEETGPATEPQEETVTAVDPQTTTPETDGEQDAFKRKRDSRLYYIRVTEDGSIYPQPVVRPVYYSDSPMTETIKALLSGPTIDELNMGLLNLIPDGTQLESAWVKDGVAYLNFNEAFRFNPMGVEGFLAQLQQIVFSTTEFSTIERVQILIEGERVDYLGGEGIYIGEPLGRENFSS